MAGTSITELAQKDIQDFRQFWINISKGDRSANIIKSHCARYTPATLFIFFWGDYVQGSDAIFKKIDSMFNGDKCPAPDMSTNTQELYNHVAWSTDTHCQITVKDAFGHGDQKLVSVATFTYQRDASKPNGVALVHYQESNVPAETTMKFD